MLSRQDTEMAMKYAPKKTFTILYLERDLYVFVRVSEVMARYANIWILYLFEWFYLLFL